MKLHLAQKPQKSISPRAFLFLAFFVVLVSLGAALYLFVTSDDEQMPSATTSVGCAGEYPPVFTNSPTDISKISLISPPIMQVGTGIKSHSYIETAEPAAVYAPVDGTLVGGAKYQEDYVDGTKIQYTLLFSVGCEVSYYYDHLIGPPEKIAELFPGKPQINESRSDDRFSLPVKAGELVGYSWARQFDFGVLDNTTEPALAEFDEYRESEKAYAVCPLKFFDKSLKAQLFEKVGYFEAADLTVIDNLCD